MWVTHHSCEGKKCLHIVLLKLLLIAKVLVPIDDMRQAIFYMKQATFITHKYPLYCSGSCLGKTPPPLMWAPNWRKRCKLSFPPWVSASWLQPGATSCQPLVFPSIPGKGIKAGKLFHPPDSLWDGLRNSSLRDHQPASLSKIACQDRS